MATLDRPGINSARDTADVTIVRGVGRTRRNDLIIIFAVLDMPERTERVVRIAVVDAAEDSADADVVAGVRVLND